MNTIRLSNISLELFRRFLFEQGCEREKKGTNKGRGGHEKWSRKDLPRPVTLQTHIDPVPEMVVKNSLRNIGVSRREFEEWFVKQK